jgi:hypothetical protein
MGNYAVRVARLEETDLCEEAFGEDIRSEERRGVDSAGVDDVVRALAHFDARAASRTLRSVVIPQHAMHPPTAR